MFQLTDEEHQALRSPFATIKQREKPLRSHVTSKGRGGNRYLPYAFTRNGAAMLSSVLHSDTATGVQCAFVRLILPRQTLCQSYLRNTLEEG